MPPTSPTPLLLHHHLPTTNLHPAPFSTTNSTWLTDTHVVRLSERTDHAREAHLALQALARGVRTARPVAWGKGYGIWERLPGKPASMARELDASVWRELLTDLARLHEAPLEPPPATLPTTWQGDLGWLERTAPEAGWSRLERKLLRRFLSEVHPVRRPVFVHGDAYGNNVLVDDAGGYVGVIDWGCAGWQSREAEAARLEDAALAVAAEVWGVALDWRLVWAMRLELFLEVAAAGRMGFGPVREVLGRLERLT